MRLIQAGVGAFAAVLILSIAPARAEHVVRWVTTLAPSGLDPHAFSNLQTRGILLQVFETLVDIDWRENLEPSLALRWSLVSPTVWRFELRPGVTFHDGEPLTAEEVVFSLTRVRAPGSAWSDFLATVARVEASDPLTIVVTTRAPDLILPYKLTYASIFPKRWAESHGTLAPTASGPLATDTAAWRGAGSGPFVVESFEPGARVTLTRNPNWWGAGTYPDGVDRIEQTVVKSREEAAGRVLQGEADYFATQQAPPGLLARLEATPGVRVTRAETANTQDTVGEVG